MKHFTRKTNKVYQVLHVLQALQKVMFILSLNMIVFRTIRVDQQHRNFLTKFRVSNMKIPITTDRWYNINKELRM